MDMIYRQGDVLFVARNGIPNGFKVSEDAILVRGETTGHAHRAQQLQVFRNAQDQMYVQGNGQIVHEEHGPLELEGTFEVIRQREYNPVANRQVMD